MENTDGFQIAFDYVEWELNEEREEEIEKILNSNKNKDIDMSIYLKNMLTKSWSWIKRIAVLRYLTLSKE